MKNPIKHLYRAPFHSRRGIYIFDADNNMVADFVDMTPGRWRVTGGPFRVRGWGRIQYMKDGDNLFTTCQNFLTDVVKDVRMDPKACVDKLNDVWLNS